MSEDRAATTLRRARADHFAEHGMPPDGGYGERWARLRIGPFPFAFPNTEGRRRVAPAHDLHHVLTGYGTDLTGEGELAAWEIGAGCRDRSALQLELRVMGFALAFGPRRVFRAFLRGRRSRHLLGIPVDDALLDRPVPSVREELGLALPPRGARRSDRLAFAGWALAAAALVWGPLVPLAALLWWLAA
jgi:hypothetical protein